MLLLFNGGAAPPPETPWPILGMLLGVGVVALFMVF